MAATKKAQARTQDEATSTETAGVTQPEPEPQPQEPKPVGVTEQRATLRALGLKRCPGHTIWWDGLPDEAKQPVEGQTDPSIRKLSEFGSSASCKACVKVRNAQHRQAANVVTGHHGQLVRRMVALMRHQDELAAKYKALKAEMTEDELAQVEAAYHEQGKEV